MKSNLLLVEDHQVLRDGLRNLIEAAGDFEVVAEASDGATAVELARRLQPDIALMDIWLPRLSGIEATRQITAGGRTRVLMLTQHDTWGFVHESLKAGASGYVVKTSPVGQVLTALRAVRAGQTFLSPEIAGQVADAALRPDRTPESPLAVLSSREREVLQLIGEGLSSKEIAELLGVSVRTIETHRAATMQKLGIHKAVSLVRFALREGLIGP
jgi:DNA-binding NarL/FixJ family response regulator